MLFYDVQNLIEDMPFPTLLFNSLIDSWQLFYVYGWPKYPISSDGVPAIKQQYSDPLHVTVYDALVAAQAANPNIHYFTYSCIVHCLCGRDYQFPMVMTGGYRLPDVVNAWYHRNATVAMYDNPWTMPQAPYCSNVII